jgi:hypothetical protein
LKARRLASGFLVMAGTNERVRSRISDYT